MGYILIQANIFMINVKANFNNMNSVGSTIYSNKKSFHEVKLLTLKCRLLTYDHCIFKNPTNAYSNNSDD